MRPFPLTRAAAIAAMIISLAPSARAETAPIPPSISAPETSAYLIHGFRSARFGMDLETVRAAAARDFNIEPQGMLVQAHPDGQTTSLQAGLMRLNPGPGPAIVTYVFGREGAADPHQRLLDHRGQSQRPPAPGYGECRAAPAALFPHAAHPARTSERRRRDGRQHLGALSRSRWAWSRGGRHGVGGEIRQDQRRRRSIALLADPVSYTQRDLFREPATRRMTSPT